MQIRKRAAVTSTAWLDIVTLASSRFPVSLNPKPTVTVETHTQ
jgi:hypothetical protein